MADVVTNFFDQLMNGTTGGVPNIYIILGLALFALLIYFMLTRTPRGKEFKPLDMKKETKRRFKRDYKYNGKSMNLFIYNSTDRIKPIAYGIGYMKEMENKTMKRYEPIVDKVPEEKRKEVQENISQAVFKKPYAELSPKLRKELHPVIQEQLEKEKIQEVPANQMVKYVRGRKETVYFEQVPLLIMKVCPPSMMSRLMARIFSYGIDWFILEEWQVEFENDKVILTADFQRRTPFDIFVFSPKGKDFVQDITYQQERENIWQETANQIPRAVHFDTEASKQLLQMRETAKLEKEKHRAQTETHEMR